MTSRRGVTYFWIVQVLLVPVAVCFGATLFMKLRIQPGFFWGIGAGAGIVQVPAFGLATVFVIASALGKLLSPARQRFLYAELVVTSLMLGLVFLWRSVYRW